MVKLARRMRGAAEYSIRPLHFSLFPLPRIGCPVNPFFALPKSARNPPVAHKTDPPLTHFESSNVRSSVDEDVTQPRELSTPN